MAPARSRTTHDESKTDHNQKTNNHGTGNARNRKNGNAASTNAVNNKQDAASAASNTTAGQDSTQASGSGLQWSNEGLETLQSYRNAYRLETPSAFKSPITAAILAAPGIGRYSPTMARRKDKRKIPKEQLAMAVRKHFNSVAVNETEVITDFVYATKNQETDRTFKMRFAPMNKPKHHGT